MSNAQDLKNLEISITDAKEAIAAKEALDRLEKNADFNDLIQKGFLEKHIIRQVLLKAHPKMQSDEMQNLLDKQITSAGGFKQYLISIYTQGCNAEQALAEDEATMEELLKEDLANG